MQNSVILFKEKMADLWALWQLKYGQHAVVRRPEELDQLATCLSDEAYCFAALNKVSRSFALVIRQLPAELRLPVCVFYLVLRALDSIEDDMQLPSDEKLHYLKNFYLYCADQSFSISHVGDTPDYRSLMRHYYKIAHAYNQLHPAYQAVIQTICRSMGNGMAEFVERRIITIADYDEYCHYVAGLVGYGLSGLFSASGYEDVRLKDQLHISNAMGLLLQKTNIIRDFHEDNRQGRTFWPEAIWKKYAGDLHWFTQHAEDQAALNCLVEMINDALQHVPDCLQYLRLIHNSHIFRFCAIPQVMAVATLAEIFANPDVFRKHVKISRGLAARIITEVYHMQHVEKYIIKFLRHIENRLTLSLPACADTEKIIRRVRHELHHPSPYQWEQEDGRVRIIEKVG